MEEAEKDPNVISQAEVLSGFTVMNLHLQMHANQDSIQSLTSGMVNVDGGKYKIEKHHYGTMYF